MDEAAREQQREARRQKVLARSRGERSAVVDLATQQDIAPQGATADLDQDPPAPPEDDYPAAEDSSKSASRLAAERRRQRILSKSTERMAKVQGDRVIRDAGDAQEAQGAGKAEGDASESLDDMLQAAEAEFFGQPEGPGIAEAKPATPQRAYFKSSKGGRGATQEGSASAGGVSPSAADAAQSKPVGQRASAAGAFKPARSEVGAGKHAPVASRPSTRRPTGNKALDKQPFDLAAVQSLAGADKGKGTDPTRKRFLGGVRFWSNLEGVTKAVLLLLVGAGVGGLLLPEGRAAVAQAKFEEKHMRGLGGLDSRSRLESFLAGVDRSPAGSQDEERLATLDVDWDQDEFGDAPSSPSKTEETSEWSGDEAEKEGGGSTKPADADAGADVDVDVDVAGEVEDPALILKPRTGDVEDSTEDGMLAGAGNWFLNHMDSWLGWAHSVSDTVLPWVGGKRSCVPAIVLAILVRLMVGTVFAGARVVLGLPAFPPAADKSKSGMVMGFVLASVPTLGKLLAFGNLVKSILSDTTLVIAGTVFTLALCLGVEEDSGPIGFIGSLLGGLGRLMFGVGEVDGTLKEL